MAVRQRDVYRRACPHQKMTRTHKHTHLQRTCVGIMNTHFLFLLSACYFPLVVWSNKNEWRLGLSPRPPPRSLSPFLPLFSPPLTYTHTHRHTGQQRVPKQLPQWAIVWVLVLHREYSECGRIEEWTLLSFLLYDSVFLWTTWMMSWWHHGSFFHLGQVDYKFWVWVVKKWAFHQTRTPLDQISYIHQYIMITHNVSHERVLMWNLLLLPLCLKLHPFNPEFFFPDHTCVLCVVISW